MKPTFDEALEYLHGADYYLVNGTLAGVRVFKEESVYSAPRIIIFGPVHVSIREKDVSGIQVNHCRSGINFNYDTQTISIIPLHGKHYEHNV